MSTSRSILLPVLGALLAAAAASRAQQPLDGLPAWQLDTGG